MHIPTVLSGVFTALLANTATAQTTSCWTTTPTCRGYFANKDNATLAIGAACDKIKCTQGSTPSPAVVTGTVRGFPYTATLRVGNQCAGIAPWSREKCVDLWLQELYPACKDDGKAPAPPGDFPLVSKSSSCDDSWLSFNFGG